MNQQNRLAFGLTGLTAFLLGAGTYWVTFDRPSEAPPTVLSGPIADGTRPTPDKPPPKVKKLRPEKSREREVVSRRPKDTPDTKPRPGSARKRRPPRHGRQVKIRPTPPAG